MLTEQNPVGHHMPDHRFIHLHTECEQDEPWSQKRGSKPPNPLDRTVKEAHCQNFHHKRPRLQLWLLSGPSEYTELMVIKCYILTNVRGYWLSSKSCFFIYVSCLIQENCAGTCNMGRTRHVLLSHVTTLVCHCSFAKLFAGRHSIVLSTTAT